jgi:hypothetical protein
MAEPIRCLPEIWWHEQIPSFRNPLSEKQGAAVVTISGILAYLGLSGTFPGVDCRFPLKMARNILHVTCRYFYVYILYGRPTRYTMSGNFDPVEVS